MCDILLEKINHIEKILMEINTKIDNFLGFEELGEGEKKEIAKIRKEIKKGDYVRFEDVFSE